MISGALQAPKVELKSAQSNNGMHPTASQRGSHPLTWVLDALCSRRVMPSVRRHLCVLVVLPDCQIGRSKLCEISACCPYPFY
jgi:hypothetical protein